MKVRIIAVSLAAILFVAFIMCADVGDAHKSLNQTEQEPADSVWQLDDAGTIVFCGQTFDLSIREFRERLQAELWYLHTRKGWLYSVAQRMGRYGSLIETELIKSDLPADLKYLSGWESGLDPLAKSWAGAVGLWQFIPSTGSHYGLVINSRYDERKDPFKSTQAACKFLRDRYAEFGDWSLVLASYNHGQNGVSTKLKKQKVDHFIDLFLPQETYRFVFQVMALSYVFKHQLLGELTWLKPFAPLPANQLETKHIRKTMALSELSSELGIKLSDFKLLNSHLPVTVTPGKYPVRLPI